jgi:tetratricopeptide (TPR) repeat protein
MDARWPAPHTERSRLAHQRMWFALATSPRTVASWIDAGLGHAEEAVRLGGQAPDADALEARATHVYMRWLNGLEPDARKAEALLDRAEADYRASIAANPNQASALTSLGHLLVNRGRVAEGQIAATEAYEKDPYLKNANTTVWRLFGTALDLEDERNATRWCAEGQRRFPADVRFVECQILLFALEDYPPNVPKVWQLLEAYVELSPPEIRDFRRMRGQMLVAVALARAGLADSARAVIARSQVDARMDPTRELAYFEAVAHTLMGDQDRAFELLALIVATNPSQRQSFATDQTWWFRELRRDPRYKTLTGSAS